MKEQKSMRSEFASNGVAIRRFRPEDVWPLYEAVRESFPDLSAWLAWCHPGYTIDDTSQFVLSRDADWEKGEHYSFGIVAPATGLLLGSVGLNFINRAHNFANIGYWVRNSCRGRGIAPAAVKLVARFGFQELGFSRLEIVAAVGNVPSQRVAEKAGATREGVLRKRLQLHGQARDVVMFSLVPEDLS